MMKISDDGLRDLIKSEGTRLQVYDDRTGKTVSSYSQVRGYPTIGVGHLITAQQRAAFRVYLGGGRKLTQYQVMELLRKDVAKFEKTLNQRIVMPMTQSMWDALTSMAFNTGANSYAVKDAIKKINNKDYTGAARAILNGPVKSKGRVLQGLVKRRKKEAMLFMKDGIPGGTQKVALGVGLVSLLGLSAFFGTRYVKEHGLPTLPNPFNKRDAVAGNSLPSVKESKNDSS